MNLFQQDQGHFPHLRVCGGRTPQLQEMPPFPNVGRHNHFSFQAVGKNRTGFLRGGSKPKKAKIMAFGKPYGRTPFTHFIGIFIPKTRLDHRDFIPKPILAVIAIAGGFLTVCGQPVANNLMGNPTITDKLHREGTVFQNSFMAPFDDTGHECRGAGIRDLGFRLIAHPPTLFQSLQNGGPINGG